VRGSDHETEITISIEDGYYGRTKTVALHAHQEEEKGRIRIATHTYQVRIPAGIKDGGRIRLRGKGGVGKAGGPPGDLYLKVHLEPHPRFRIDGEDLHVIVPVSPWEAALGGDIEVELLDGRVNLRIAPGTQSGQKLRLRRRGYPKAGGKGDLLAEIRIAIPKELSSKEKQLWTEISKVSRFNPRS
jgi:curved DNA-binding protein